MGQANFVPGTDSATKSIKVRSNLQENAEDGKKHVKVLFLGALESGKTTLVKQMKILYQNGYSEEERLNYKSLVYANVVQSMLAIIEGMEYLNISFSEPDCAEHARKLSLLTNNLKTELTTEIGNLLKILWNDGGVRDCYARSSAYQLSDSAGYFLNALDRLCSSSYVPSEQDVLRTRVRTTGIIETKFEYNNLHFNVIDVGGARCERKKWIHCFKDVTAIVYCVGMSGYDQVLWEDEEINRMKESLVLFEKIVNNLFFSKTALILFLSKKDLFAEKITNSPLTICFPEYAGKNEYEPASLFIREQFENQNKHKETKKFYTHSTCVTDTKNIRYVFDSVCDLIMRKILDKVFGSDSD